MINANEPVAEYYNLLGHSPSQLIIVAILQQKALVTRKDGKAVEQRIVLVWVWVLTMKKNIKSVKSHKFETQV